LFFKRVFVLSIDEIYSELPCIGTERLVLREITLADVEDIFAYSCDPEVFLYVGGSVHKTIEDSRKFIGEVLKQFEDQEILMWGIYHKGDKRLIGDCGFIQWDRKNKRTELDYLLSKDYWNQGLMTEAVRALIEFGFEQMKLERIQAICETANVASSRVMEKVGMQYEGLLRSYIRYEGKCLDMKMHSITRQDWTK
jgi:ribosomal-protein-alanine N-acetyltransferase